MKLWRLSLILLLIPIVHAASYDSVNRLLTVGDTIDDNTRLLELVSVTETRAVVEIDSNFTKVVLLGETKTIEGVNVTLNETFYVPNASERQARIIMQVLWKHLCNTDADCNDGDACTLNYCTGYPRRCDYDDSEKEVTECKADGCCASSCNYFNDPDCDKPCVKDRDCNDNNPGTIDTCSGTQGSPGKCEYLPQTECIISDDFCPVGCEYGTDIGETIDRDCSQNNECSIDTDCDDKNPGTTESCIGYGTDENPRVCIYDKVTDCIFNDDFCPSGCTDINDNDCSRNIECGNRICETTETCDTCKVDCGCDSGLVCSDGKCVDEIRVCDNIGEHSNLSFGGTFYCSETGWKSIKSGGSLCQEDYECKSGLCEDNGKCVAEELVKEKQDQKIAFSILGIFLVGVTVYLIVLFKISNKAEKL